VPGEQADAVLVLEGKQGKGKSSVFRILAETAQKGMVGMPEDTTLFLDSPLELGSKDAYETIRGKWIAELAEMASIKKGDIDKQKTFLSSRIDSFRESYGRFSRDWKRTSVFCGTVNPDGLGYLRDPTGARRFWPVAIGEIDLRGLRRDALQIWAEATKLYQGGAVWYPSPEEQVSLEEEQAKRLNVLEDDDVWLPVVARALAMWTGKTRVTLSDVFARAFPELGQHNIAHQDTIRMARILVKIGWRKVRQAGTGRAYVYTAPPDWTDRSRLYIASGYPSSAAVLDDN
jgi:putative DNA primase/helicase